MFGLRLSPRVHSYWPAPCCDVTETTQLQPGADRRLSLIGRGLSGGGGAAQFLPAVSFFSSFLSSLGCGTRPSSPDTFAPAFLKQNKRAAVTERVRLRPLDALAVSLVPRGSLAVDIKETRKLSENLASSESISARVG